MENIVKMAVCYYLVGLSVRVAEKLISKLVIKLARSNYLLFTFCLILKLIFLQVNKVWIDNTLTDGHLHNICHTLR